MLAGMIAKALDMSVGAADDMTAHGRCAAIAHPAGRLPLVVGQRASRREVVEVLPEDLLHGHGHARILAEMLQRLCGKLQSGSTTVSRVALAIGMLEGELARIFRVLPPSRIHSNGSWQTHPASCLFAGSSTGVIRIRMQGPHGYVGTDQRPRGTTGPPSLRFDARKRREIGIAA